NDGSRVSPVRRAARPSLMASILVALSPDLPAKLAGFFYVSNTQSTYILSTYSTLIGAIHR
ncbi:MAG: hypothetical protein ACRC9G_17190, partial [Aeromonas veronii]